MPAASGPAKLKLGDIYGGHTYMGGDPSNQTNWVDPDALAATGKTGDEFLQLLQAQHPTLVNTVKAMSEGRQAIPANRVMVDPYWSTAFKLAQQYDPALDQTTYPLRQKTSTEFKAGGTAAQNIRNLNQGIGHLNDLVQAIPGVAGHSGLLGLSHLINMGQNYEADMAGDPNYTKYSVPRTALAGELASIFKGKGASNESEVNKYYDLLGPNSSTAQKYQAAGSLAALLKSRLDELGDQFQQGMGKTPAQIRILNPTAQEDFDGALTHYNSIQKASGQTDQAPAPQSSVDPTTKALLQKYKVPGY